MFVFFVNCSFLWHSLKAATDLKYVTSWLWLLVYNDFLAFILIGISYILLQDKYIGIIVSQTLSLNLFGVNVGVLMNETSNNEQLYIWYYIVIFMAHLILKSEISD